MIDYAKKSGVQEVMLNTNLLLMNRANAEQFIRSPLGVLTFSLDAETSATYSRIRCGGRFDRALANAMQYFDLRKQMGIKGPHVIAQMIPGRRSPRPYPDFDPLSVQANPAHARYMIKALIAHPPRF